LPTCESGGQRCYTGETGWQLCPTTSTGWRLRSGESRRQLSAATADPPGLAAGKAKGRFATLEAKRALTIEPALPVKAAFGGEARPDATELAAGPSGDLDG
jgi:hypothetical protein